MSLADGIGKAKDLNCKIIFLKQWNLLFLFQLSKIFNNFWIFPWLSNFYQFSMTFQDNLFFQDFQWFSMTVGTLRRLTHLTRLWVRCWFVLSSKRLEIFTGKCFYFEHSTDEGSWWRKPKGQQGRITVAQKLCKQRRIVQMFAGLREVIDILTQMTVATWFLRNFSIIFEARSASHHEPQWGGDTLMMQSHPRNLPVPQA